MKKGILFLLLISSAFAHAQSLKEALYSGKLKNQPGTVIRKGEDLSSKMDTASKAPTDSALVKTPVFTVDSSAKGITTPAGSTLATGTDKNDSIAGLTDTAAAGETVNAPKENTAAPKDNNAVWKDYMNTLTATLKTEVLPSKKVKRETYYIMVSYAIGTDGEVAINDVLVTPENAFLQQQIKERLTLGTPRLTPVVSSSGTPRKTNKRYNFTLTKE
jgi:hypothetical protein